MFLDQITDCKGLIYYSQTGLILILLQQQIEITLQYSGSHTRHLYSASTLTNHSELSQQVVTPVHSNSIHQTVI